MFWSCNEYIHNLLRLLAKISGKESTLRKRSCVYLPCLFLLQTFSRKDVMNACFVIFGGNIPKVAALFFLQESILAKEKMKKKKKVHTKNETASPAACLRGSMSFCSLSLISDGIRWFVMKRVV